ncbi:MAG: molybdopterin-dependent oxidoreductase, partial [Chloroflexota bacterium]
MDERVIVSRDPLNAEARLELQEGVITPAARHYVRSHFSAPASPAAITIGGAVRTPRSITIQMLRALPPRSATVTLECAGNGRAFLAPPAPGEQWKLGAVSTASWTGVPLRTLL